MGGDGRDRADTGDADRSVTFRVGDEELVVRRKYETLSIVNDLMIGVWFVVGSSMFFSEATQTAGTVMFLLGSVQLLIRPVIRLTRNLHLQRVSGSTRSVLMGSSDDF
jgi:hypothetical protein